MTEHRQIIVRAYNVELEDVEDRMIRGRCVPYGEVATVDDGNGSYKEMFQRGAFRKVMSAPNRVILDFEHQNDMLNRIGHGVEFVERDDGLHGTFRALEGAVGDQGLEFVRAGVLTGLSVRAFTMGPGRRDGQVLVRTACHLDSVALCRQPAYSGAVIETLRARPMPLEPGELTALRPPANPELDERLRALGISV